jgi:lysyl-tRNA synthetase class 2
VLRLWCTVLTFLSRWWQLESLYRANAKYRPVWEPRYLLFEKSSDLPRIGVAAARAEGFLTPPALPALGRRPLLRAPGGRTQPPHEGGLIPGQQTRTDGGTTPDARTDAQTNTSSTTTS